MMCYFGGNLVNSQLFSSCLNADRAELSTWWTTFDATSTGLL